MGCAWVMNAFFRPVARFSLATLRGSEEPASREPDFLVGRTLAVKARFVKDTGNAAAHGKHTPVRQHDAPALPVKEPRPQDFLERANLRADGRLRYLELLRRTRDPSLTRGRLCASSPSRASLCVESTVVSSSSRNARPSTKDRYHA